MDINEIFSSFEDVDYTAMDKDSAAYKEAQLTNAVKRNTENEPLTIALKEATHLDEQTKKKYVSLAELYISNMHKNIFKNQFQLADDYLDTTVDEWNDFLSDRIVNVYITKHKRTLLKTAAEDNLSNPNAKNKRDNLKLIENLEAQESKEAHKNVVIMRLPDIYDDES